MLRVLRVHVLPEAVLDPVRPHVHHHQEVPLLGCHQVLRVREAAGRQRVDVAEDAFLVLGPEVGDVEDVLPDLAAQLVLQLAGIGEVVLDRRCEEAADPAAVDRRRGVRGGHADDHRLQAGGAGDVPHRRRLHRIGGGEGQALIGVVLPVAEPVDAERAGTAARHHARPRRNRDRRFDRAQGCANTLGAEAAQVGQQRRELVEDKLRRRAVETDDQDFGRQRRTPLWCEGRLATLPEALPGT